MTGLRSAAVLLAIAASCCAAEFGGRPWAGQYKIRPDQTERLTAADVVGPDGLVYPNWTKCGVQNDGPRTSRTVSLETAGGKADDDKDDSAALARACEQVGRAGGGVVTIGEGIWHLDRPVTIRHDSVLIRGAGRDKTRLIFRYRIGGDGASFYSPAPGQTVGPNTRIELHCAPTNLQSMQILVDDKPVGNWERGEHSGNSFSYAIRGSQITRAVANGKHILKGVGTYSNGSTRQTQTEIVVDSAHRDDPDVAESSAAIMFAGQGNTGAKLLLAEDGRRGDARLVLKSAAGLRSGDKIIIDGPATERWKTLTKNKCLWGLYRMYAVEVAAVEGNTISLGQPLRIEFPTIDGSSVQKVRPIQFCGIEDLTIEQTQNLWITAVMFNHGWNCRAEDVTVKKCGRFPIYGSSAKWCTIRRCTFDDAWFKGGGGTAYTGWEKCWDCLMEDVTTYKMRHAPCFQWATSGCVIRNSVFHDSDGQWHAGWTNENLIEQCVIESVRGNGGYGYGMWASPPEDTAHGPNGPRNVVYNCDVTSQLAGLWMGGMNEGWMILHNRFTVETGPAVFARTSSFDHTIAGNVFVVKDGKSPMVQLATEDCVGVETADNALYGGNGKLLTGKAPDTIERNNKTQPIADKPARPTPEVPSIYQWQLDNVGKQ